MENEKFDNIIKSKFQNFEVQPTAHVWNAISNTIADSPTPASNPKKVLGYGGILTKLGIILGVIATAFVIFFAIQHQNNANTFFDKKTEHPEKPVFNDTAVNAATDNKPKTINLKYKPQLKVRELRNPMIQKNADSKTVDKLKPENETQFSTAILKSFMDRKGNSLLKKLQANYPKLEESKTSMEVTYPISSRIRDVHIPALRNKTQSMRRLSKYLSNSKLSLGQSYDPRNIQLGVFITPEKIIFNSDELQDYNAIALDFEARYMLSESSFIRSGISFSYSENSYDYHLYHTTYDKIGTYNDVYDVELDAYGNITNYLTEEVVVYDSVIHDLLTQTNNKYTYLQIPILYGQEFELSPRWSYSFNTGPLISFLIKEGKELDLDLNEYALTAAPIDYTPNRINTNLQYVIAVGLNYELAKNLSIYLEPRYKYFVSNLYDGNKHITKKPYSIGFKFGIFYKINKKK